MREGGWGAKFGYSSENTRTKMGVDFVFPKVILTVSGVSLFLVGIKMLWVQSCLLFTFLLQVTNVTFYTLINEKTFYFSYLPIAC